MTTLATAISTAITKSLLAKLPSELAAKFDIEETEAKEFLQGFLTSQLGKAAKGGRSAGPKGKNGKGRISGYILFSNENRDGVKESTPDLKFTEVGKMLGQMWGELTDEEKGEWNQKAGAQNEANGLPAPNVKATFSKGKGNATKGQTGTKGKASAKTATATAAGGSKITRHPATKSWVIHGTSFVVVSPKNKTVVGKLRANKVVALSTADRKKCQDSDWAVEAAVKAPVKVTKGKAKPAPVEVEDDDDSQDEECSDDDDSQDDDDE